MADSDGEFVADDGSDDEMLGQGGSSYDTRGAARDGGGGGGDKKGKRKGKAAWEDLQRSWDVAEELAEGGLSLEGRIEAEKRRRVLRDTTPIQRGIIRHLVMVLDMSLAMDEKDMLPSRHRVAVAYAVDFAREFFDQNPISQLAIIGMRDGVAVRISDMSGNPADHIEKLRQLVELPPMGNPSLQNALEMCRGTLFNTPSHGTREVVMIFGALSSSDPGDIHETIDGLVTDRIRVSIIGLSAQVFICEDLCRRTNASHSASEPILVGGNDESSGYMVAIDDVHFRELLLSVTRPPATRQSQLQQQGAAAGGGGGGAGASLLMMGFPSRTTGTDPALCACHNRPTRDGFLCTRCGSRVCRLPAECPACGLTLILSTHLARSYHHLFPLRIWVEVPWSDAHRSVACFACLAPFPDPATKGGGAAAAASAAAVAQDKRKGKEGSSGRHLEVPSASTKSGRAQKKKGGASAAPETPKGVSESSRYMCQVCRKHFCIDCDVFAHEVVHNCPGCQGDTRDEVQQQAGGENGNGRPAANGKA
ncbi:hypothetical protein RB595_004473 [Gaeumannomyces hyphopodioides]